MAGPGARHGRRAPCRPSHLPSCGAAGPSLLAAAPIGERARAQVCLESLDDRRAPAPRRRPRRLTSCRPAGTASEKQAQKSRAIRAKAAKATQCHAGMQLSAPRAKKKTHTVPCWHAAIRLSAPARAQGKKSQKFHLYFLFCFFILFSRCLGTVYFSFKFFIFHHLNFSFFFHFSLFVNFLSL